MACSHAAPIRTIAAPSGFTSLQPRGRCSTALRPRSKRWPKPCWPASIRPPSACCSRNWGWRAKISGRRLPPRLHRMTRHKTRSVMAEPSLKVVSDPASISDGAKSSEGTKSLAKKSPRRRLRMILLLALPLAAAAIGAFMYLGSGRYISTDNAYVGAQKVLITPDVSGKIASIAVAEGQRVNAGDALMEIDPEPFRIAVTQAEARVAGVRTEFANLKTTFAS